MIIHVVQTGETLSSIADYYGVSIRSVMEDNGLGNQDNLVVGQSLVISKPTSVYSVKEGDTLGNIAAQNNISFFQLLANNPFLSDREYLIPGDTLIINHEKKGSIISHGFTGTNISNSTLQKTLPYLTYLSILNFTATKEGEILSYYDETEIIKLSKAYSVVPLMFLTTLTMQGGANIAIDFDIILNEDFQDRQITNILDILKTKGYAGLNLSLQYISLSNIQFYDRYFEKVTNRLNEEGYEVFVTINPNISQINNDISFQRIDYSPINLLAENIIFMNYEWSNNINIPSPISSIYRTELFLNFILNYIPPEKIIIGIATLGYDWELPYVSGISNIYSISYNNAINLAQNYGATIQFDIVSQTPYFNYTANAYENHIVWFMDARSINATLDLISKYGLAGISIWNLAIFNPQLMLIVNAQYDIVKASLD